MLNPEEVDRKAKRRQAELVAAHGGREAVIRRGSFAYSPPPGFKAEFDQ
jgi:choline-sulfatase